MKRNVLGLAAGVVLAAAFVSSSAQAVELVVNGDFEAGATGFTTAYGQVTTDAANLHAFSDWGGFGDHTSGTGNMLVLAPTGSTTAAAWQETVAVTPGQNYTYSFWSATTNTTTRSQ